MWAKHKKSGFTIVELLIVIVVIGILAAITIVAFNGVQQRTSNTQRIAAVRSYVSAIKSYSLLNQKYPLASSTFCVGESNITDYDVDPNADCGVSDNLKHDHPTYTPAFNANIKSVTGSLPNFPGKPVQLSVTIKGLGFLARADQYDPTGENIGPIPTLIYFLEGANQDCVLGPLVTPYGGGSYIKTTAKNSFSDIGTACRIMLDDPTKM